MGFNEGRRKYWSGKDKIRKEENYTSGKEKVRKERKNEWRKRRLSGF